MLQGSLYAPVMAVDHAVARERHERDFFRFAGFESRRRAGRDVEAHSIGGLAFEMQRAVHFEEMKMAADLDGTVPCVPDQKGCSLAARIGQDDVIS